MNPKSPKDIDAKSNMTKTKPIMYAIQNLLIHFEGGPTGFLGLFLFEG
jgi:hypothetical protein